MPAFDSNKAAAVLASAAAAIIERQLLVWRTLDEAKTNYPNLQGVHQTLALLARDIESFNHWPLVAQTYQRLKTGAAKYPDQEYQSGRTVLESASSQLIRLHQYLSLLPIQEVPPTLRSVLSLSYGHEFAQISPVVLLLPELEYYEFDLTSWVNNDPIFPSLATPPSMREKVIRISAVDGSAPLAWPILAHEFGHAIAQFRGMEGNLDSRVAGKLVIAPDAHGNMLRRFYRELLADLIAAVAFGPSCALALIRFEQLLWPLSGYFPQTSDSHPSTKARVQCVEQFLGNALNKPLQDRFDNYRECVDFLLPPAIRATEQVLESQIFPHLQTAAIAEVSSANFKRFDVISQERTERLEDRLDRGLPPCAVRSQPKTLVRPLLEASAAAHDKARFETAVSQLREVPASPGEVVTAGYLLREKRLPIAIDEVLTSWDPNRAWRDNVRPINNLLVNDSLLGAAIETVEVHTRIADKLVTANVPASAAAPTSGSTGSPVRAAALLSDSAIALRLVDEDARQRIYVTPMIDPAVQLGPASLDVRLGTDALVITNVNLDSLDPLRPLEDCQKQVDAYTRRIRITSNEPLVLHPNEFALAATLEFVKLPGNLAARLEGRSSWQDGSCGRTGPFTCSPVRSTPQRRGKQRPRRLHRRSTCQSACPARTMHTERGTRAAPGPRWPCASLRGDRVQRTLPRASQ